jgi:hypothetical protein
MEFRVIADPNRGPSLSFSEEASQTPPAPETEQSQASVATPTRRRSVWLLRIRALLFVTLCATFGVLLIILPWTPKWTDNPLLLPRPELRQLFSNGFVRGLCSGLGVLDLWLGFWEAIYYHEKP